MNMIPNYIPSNTTPEEVLAMLRDWLPLDVGYSVTVALENVQSREQEAAEEAAYDAGYDQGGVDENHRFREAITDAIQALEAIPDDNGADASTDRAIAEALKVLRAA